MKAPLFIFPTSPSKVPPQSELRYYLITGFKPKKPELNGHKVNLDII